MRQKGVCNWGRWGAEDEKGTLNYLTAEKIRKAANLVKRGKVYSLAVPLGKDGPNIPTRNKTWHVTMYSNDPSPGGKGRADDMIVMHTHGTTHIDALGHAWYNSKLYNGYSCDNVNSDGAAKGAIDNVRSLVGRGLLLDIARYKEVDHLEKGYVINPSDLEGCARQEGVTIECGDILLIRTGWYRVFGENQELFYSGEPGVGMAAAEWFGQRELCALGADTFAVEASPHEAPTPFSWPVHRRLITDQGAYLMEFLDLEELAYDQVYEFLFVAAPLRITKGLGSPINPLAIA